MTRLYLFVSSLSPGILVAGIRGTKENFLIGLIVAVLAVMLSLLGLLVIRSRTTLNTVDLKVDSVRDETYQVPTYLVTFVLPLLFIDVVDVPTLVGYLVFSIIVFLMLMKSNISIANPVLLLSGYRLFDVQDSSGNQSTVVSKTVPPVGESTEVHKLAEGFYILRSKKRETD